MTSGRKSGKCQKDPKTRKRQSACQSDKACSVLTKGWQLGGEVLAKRKSVAVRQGSKEACSKAVT